MDQLLPILKNRQEFEGQKQRGMFVDELFGNEQSPILMYGQDRGAYMEYSQSKTEHEDKETKEQAIKNIENLEISYEIRETKGFKIAMLEHEYAAEKILDKNYMNKIASDLDSDAIVVGIPMKGLMAVVAKGKGEDLLYGATLQQYQEAPTYPISDSLFYLVNGEIEMMSKMEVSDAAKDEKGLSEIIGENDGKGKIGFVAKVGNKSEAELVKQIQAAFQNIILHVMKDPKNFNGKVDFHINPNFHQLTNSLDKRIKLMAKNISERGVFQLIGRSSGEEFKVKFFYGDDQLIAETIEIELDELNSKNNKEKTTSNPEAQNRSPINPPKPKEKPWWKFW